MRIIPLLAALLCLSSLASEPICVRNYNSGGYNPCENHPQMFVYVIAVDEEVKVELCVRKRPGMCETAPEFRWVAGLEGGRFCVINYDQSTTSNFCESEQLKNYHYAVPG